METLPKRYRAGDTVEDRCLACKIDRLHTVIVADPAGRPIRTQCDYCGSQHNFRGVSATAPAPGVPRPAVRGASVHAASDRSGRPPLPIVTDREVRASRDAGDQEGLDMSLSATDLEVLLRRILREEAGVTPVVPADRWRGGTFVLEPGNGTQEKRWPIETFFHKVVMLRNRLRTLEQQINASELPEDAKVRLQSYITACYGSLTSFNLLFADEGDQFKGAGE